MIFGASRRTLLGIAVLPRRPAVAQPSAQPIRAAAAEVRPTGAGRIGFLAAFLLLTLMAGMLLREAWTDSLTFDEAFYIRSGVCALSNRIIDLEPTNGPAFKLLAGIGVTLLVPGAPQQCTNPAPRFNVEGDHLPFYRISPDALRYLILAARIPLIIVTLLLGLILFLWARALLGVTGGLIALALFAVEPSVLGHGHLVTGDMSVSLGIVGSLAAHWAWTRSRRRGWLIGAGLFFGFALLNKTSSLALVPVLVGLEVLSRDGRLVDRVGAAIRPLALAGGTAWALVCLVYLPFEQAYPLHHHWYPPLSWIAPPSWFFGVTYQLQHVHVGHPSYVNGMVTAAHGPWYYYPETLALKTSLGLLLLATFAAGLVLWRRARTPMLYLLLPIVVILATLIAGGMDMGVRYALAVYPMMAILAAYTLALVPRQSARDVMLHPLTRIRLLPVALALLAVSAVSSLSHFPQDIGYFNQLAGSRPERYLSESNIDWGQDAWRLKQWWDAANRPHLSTAYFGTLPLSAYGIASEPVMPSAEPVHGLLAVSVSRLTIFGDTNFDHYDGLRPPYDWMQRMRPVARIGTSIEVFDILN